MRTATVKVRGFEVVFDGEKFTSANDGVEFILNSTLQAYNAGAPPWEAGDYWPDPLVNLAAALAKYNGGELIAFDPPEPRDLPEGAVY